MNGLKGEIRRTLNAARHCRKHGLKVSAAVWLTRAGELRRTAFYIYGNRS